jgi:hypothetical protein
VLRYNTLIDLQHDLRVPSVVIPLRPDAESGNLTRTQSVKAILAGSLGILPMAPLADVPRVEVAQVIEQIDHRLIREAQEATAGRIMSATLLLAGLRIGHDEIDQLTRRLQTMSSAVESSNDRLIIAKGLKKGHEQGLKEGLMEGSKAGLKEGRGEGLGQGRIEQAKRLVRRLGQRCFGTPTKAHDRAIKAINDHQQLESLCELILDVSSWAELLTKCGGDRPSSA